MFTRHVTKELSAYCNGELSNEQSRRVRGHLLQCERCRREHGEIRLGVRLAERLPLAAAPAGMWNEIEALLDQGSRTPAQESRAPRLRFGFNWIQVAAVAGVLVVAVVIGVVWSSYYGPRASWAVQSLAGKVRIGRDHIIDIGNLAVGETLETDASSTARISVARIGEVEVGPNSRVRLLRTRITEHRLALEIGRLHAKIWAPPRLFFVDTPSAEAIDLGCEYTLEVDHAGRGLLHVTLGEVALVRNGREVYVPRYAMCQTRVGIGPGTPYFEDAPESFIHLLEKFDFENGSEDALKTLLTEARLRDTFTLWHLLSTVDENQRVRVLDRMIELAGLPKGITREGMLRLDRQTLDEWKDEMDTVWF